MISPETSRTKYYPEGHNETFVDDPASIQERLDYLQSAEIRPVGENNKFWKGLGRQKEIGRLSFELTQRELEDNNLAAELETLEQVELPASNPEN